MPKRFVSTLLVVISILFSNLPVLCQSQTQSNAPADAKALLDKANENMSQTENRIKIIEVKADAAVTKAETVGKMAEVSIQQANSIISQAQYFAWIFSIVITLAGIVLGFLGFSTLRDFKNRLKESQDVLNDYRLKLEKIDENARGIDIIHQDLIGFKESVKKRFEETRQAFFLLNRGNDLFDQGKRQRAIEIYEQAHRLLPDDPEINYRLGRAYSINSRYQEAIQKLEEAFRLKPDFAEAYMELGLAYRRKAEFFGLLDQQSTESQMAEKFLQKAIALRPDYDDALATLGGLYRRIGKHTEAQQFYRRAAQADPNSSYALNNVASYYWYFGDTERARTSFKLIEELAERRISSGGEDAFWALYDRALARLAQGRKDEALRDHQEAVNKTVDIENLRSVLHNLEFLAQSQEPMVGLDEFIASIKARIRYLDRR